MMPKKSYVLVLSTLTLAACGGGGGGGAPSMVKTATPRTAAQITTITGITVPPQTLSTGRGYLGALSVLTPPNSVTKANSVVQSTDYSFDPVAILAVPPTLLATALNIKPVDSQNSPQTIQTGAANPTDPTLGQTIAVTNTSAGSNLSLSTANGAVVSQTTDIAGLQTVTLRDPVTASASEYVLPYSATANPSGYLFQTFGRWISINPGTGLLSENYFSAGLPSVPVHLPVNGTATYSGQAAGTYVDAVTRDLADISATMNATADFATHSVTFTTSNTTGLSINAVAGTLPTPNPSLDMYGILSYSKTSATNTFTGSVTTANGMSGNVTGRFYGVEPTGPTTPPEIGGTFAVAGNGIGAMQGAFGGATAPSTAPTSISGLTVPSTGGPLLTTITASPDMLVPPNSAGRWNMISRHVNYSFDPVAAVKSISKVANVTILPVYGMDDGLTISTGAAYPTDPALGQTIGIGTIIAGTTTMYSVANGFAVSQNTDIAGLPTVTLTGPQFGGTGTITSQYAMPYSATLNPTGYTYQTFGMWSFTNSNQWHTGMDYFSAGAPTAAAALPVSGTASYAGQATGSYVDAVTGVLSRTSAIMNATADFAARSVAFGTSGTVSLPTTATTGTLPTVNPGLDMAGTLNYAAGAQTFTGVVATTNGMSGSATGRFYGPGIATATATKAAASPPEIGGTFIVSGNGIGAMQGAFGGK